MKDAQRTWQVGDVWSVKGGTVLEVLLVGPCYFKDHHGNDGKLIEGEARFRVVKGGKNYRNHAYVYHTEGIIDAGWKLLQDADGMIRANLIEVLPE